jgi:rhodanese-related sulfurtransferase
VIAPGTELVIVAEPGTELQAKVRLARIGFDNVAGALKEPQEAFLARPDVVEVASRLTVDQFMARRGEIDLAVVDVRALAEMQDGTIPGALPVPLTELRARLADLDPGQPTVVYCAGGYRSAVAASVLRHAGFADVSDIIGGYAAWSTTTLKQ